MGLHRQNLPLMILFLALGAIALLLLFPADGKQVIEASAPKNLSREMIRSSRDQELQKFSLTGFDEMGKTSWNLEGDAAKIDVGQTVYLDENVTLRLQDNTIVRTDHVQWSQERGYLRTQSEVTVDHDSVQIKGRGAVGRMQDSFIQLNRDIEMVINATTRLTCIGPFKMYYKQNKMIFYRKVKVTDERGTLTANRMDVFIDPETKKIREIIAVGDVAIQRGQDTTRSRRAIYSVETGSVRLEGSPQITLHKESEGLLNGTLGNQGA